MALNPANNNKIHESLNNALGDKTVLPAVGRGHNAHKEWPSNIREEN